jgi:hypothetical protein
MVAVHPSARMIMQFSREVALEEQHVVRCAIVHARVLFHARCRAVPGPLLPTGFDKYPRIILVFGFFGGNMILIAIESEGA